MICAQAVEHTMCSSSRAHNADSEHRNNELPLQSHMKPQYGKCEIGFLITFNSCVVKTRFCMAYEYN